eukprot:1157888-Pelagomonas_calceolata.AAC.4
MDAEWDTRDYSMRDYYEERGKTREWCLQEDMQEQLIGLGFEEQQQEMMLARGHARAADWA